MKACVKVFESCAANKMTRLFDLTMLETICSANRISQSVNLEKIYVTTLFSWKHTVGVKN